MSFSCADAAFSFLISPACLASGIFSCGGCPRTIDHWLMLGPAMIFFFKFLHSSGAGQSGGMQDRALSCRVPGVCLTNFYLLLGAGTIGSAAPQDGASASLLLSWRMSRSHCGDSCD